MDDTERERDPMGTRARTAEGTGAGAAFSAGIREPIVVCMLLAALFDELSGNPLHSIVLVGTAVALSIARARERVSTGARRETLWGEPPPVLARMRSAIDRSSC